MSKTEEKLDLDGVYLELVPRAVDDLGKDSELFTDKQRYLEYSSRQVIEFLDRLPEEYKKGLVDSNLTNETERSRIIKCLESPWELMMGFKPSYLVMLVGQMPEDFITVPTFDLRFTPVNKEGTGLILEAAVEQFFVRQADIEDGTLIAAAWKDKRTILQGLELLVKLLPDKLAGDRIIHTRCNYAYGNGMTEYKI